MKLLWWRRSKIYDKFQFPSTKPYSSPHGNRRKRIPSKILKRYYIPQNILKVTDRVFQTTRTRNKEGYAWWAGYISDNLEAQVCTVIYPQVKTHYGRIYLDRSVLSAMHKKLIEIDQILLVELHTHPPGAGGQNIVDADNAVCFYPGFITIVIPNFAKPRFYDLRDYYIYSYKSDGSWHKLNREEISQLFIIEQTVIEVK